MKYLVVIEKSKTGYGAYVPDLPGVGVVGKTRNIVKRLVKEAIDLHLEDMKMHEEKKGKNAMAVWKVNFAGNPYIGLFAKASDRLVLMPKSSPEKFEERISLLGEKVVKTSIGGSPYIGVYAAMNSLEGICG